MNLIELRICMLLCLPVRLLIKICVGRSPTRGRCGDGGGKHEHEIQKKTSSGSHSSNLRPTPTPPNAAPTVSSSPSPSEFPPSDFCDRCTRAVAATRALSTKIPQNAKKMFARFSLTPVEMKLQCSEKYLPPQKFCLCRQSMHQMLIFLNQSSMVPNCRLADPKISVPPICSHHFKRQTARFDFLLVAARSHPATSNERAP